MSGGPSPDSFRWPRSAGAVRGMQPLAAARISARPLTTPSAVAVPYLPVQMQFAIRCRTGVRKVTHAHKERRGHMTRAPSRRPWHALLDIDGYLRSQSSWLTNYTKRYPCRPARRNIDYRGNRKLSRQSANEQITADALVSKWRQSPASGSLRGLQWNARLRVRSPVSAPCQPKRAVGRRKDDLHSLDTPLAAGPVLPGNTVGIPRRTIGGEGRPSAGGHQASARRRRRCLTRDTTGGRRPRSGPSRTP